VASVVVTPADPKLTTIGRTLPLSAEAHDPDDAILVGLSFTWTSSDPAMVRVDSTGLVTAVAPGTATVNAATCGVVGVALDGHRRADRHRARREVQRGWAPHLRAHRGPDRILLGQRLHRSLGDGAWGGFSAEPVAIVGDLTFAPSAPAGPTHVASKQAGRPSAGDSTQTVKWALGRL
jgi:hypothetical protein